MIDLEEANKFSEILDNLLNTDDQVRTEAEQKVIKAIQKDPIASFICSIYKIKGKKISKNSQKK